MNLYTEEAKRCGFSVPLHALRGLAAIIVLLCHLQQRVAEAFPGLVFTKVLNGSAAVNFFYVLSGLVVGASLAKVGVSYSSTSVFFQRRFFRIMPLMFVTVTLGGLYLLFIDPYMKYSLIPKEYGDFSLAKFIASYVGYSLKPNPPIWSIFVELVASLLIPLMILAGSKVSHMILAFIGCVLLSLVPIDFKHHWNFYMFSFYLGLTVLVWGKWLAARLATLSTALFWLVVAVLFLAFYVPRLVTGAGFGDLWIVYWETACITPLVAIIFYMPERFSFLYAKVFKFFGDISFSLYLTHSLLLAIVLNAVTSLLGTTVFSAIVYCSLCIVLSFMVALISYHAIEMKGMRLGESLRGRVRPIAEAS